MLRCHVLFATRGSSDCPSLASKMTRSRKTRSLTAFGPDASCTAEFEGITFSFTSSSPDPNFLLLSTSGESTEEQAFLLFLSHCQAFLRFISLAMDPISPTLAIITHFLPAFPLFSFAGLFRHAMFLCAKMVFFLGGGGRFVGFLDL